MVEWIGTYARLCHIVSSSHRTNYKKVRDEFDWTANVTSTFVLKDEAAQHDNSQVIREVMLNNATANPGQTSDFTTLMLPSLV